jgi:NADH-quinone oxidoreductase subunit G
MVEIELDGSKVSVPEGSMVMHAADKAGVYVPHFCYHKKLSVAANCRMCLVEVEKAPKPMPACATPVTQGMVVRTKSEKAIKVMEFLLINHPLDCPICDQGGECQLQDLAVGYGGSSSRYDAEKRVVMPKDVGPLVSMEEMSRCIHCTRCVRFGQEIAGVMELGMVHRGEHSEITTVVGETIDSELSGNMIDICPVGALTSKPFRYSARTWELSRRKSISPHDGVGANLVVQVKNNRVMRVVPFENDDVNECWLADRDRFSYEALNSDQRLTAPMLKQGGEWREVDWQTALEYVANGLKQIRETHGAASIGALASPHSGVEELFMLNTLVRGLGSDNIDHRLRRANFVAPPTGTARWLGMPIKALGQLQRVLVVGSNLRKDQPLMAVRLRQATKLGCRVSRLHDQVDDWAMPVAHHMSVPATDWGVALAQIAAAVAQRTGAAAPVAADMPALAQEIAASLLSGERKAILLGNAAAHHPHADALLALAHWIATQVGGAVGYLTEAANTVGAQLVGAQPRQAGLHAAAMLKPGALKAALLWNTEPALDSAAGPAAIAALGTSEMVVTMSPFKANLTFSDVLLPIAPFTETPFSFVNAEGRLQSAYSVVRPLGQARPGWKVLRVLGELLGLQGFGYDSAAEVLARALPGVAAGELIEAGRLNNAPMGAAILPASPSAAPCVASIYQLDGLVRRAPSLQLTADAKPHDTEGSAAVRPVQGVA